jgi:hypothetical protein
MDGRPVNPIILLVGGPEDGRVIVGTEAEFFAVEFRDKPGSGGEAWEASPAQVGKGIGVGASRFVQAGQLLGMEKAGALFLKYGVGELQRSRNKYVLTTIDDNVFVYRYEEKSAVSDAR